VGIPKRLFGVVNPLGDKPCFAIPIFMENGQLYVQANDDQGIIKAFIATHVPEDAISSTKEEVYRDVLDPGLYAFQLSPYKTLVGSKKEIKQQLRIHYKRFLNNPFLCWEVAEFLGDDRLKAEAMCDASQLLLELDPEIELQCGDKTCRIGPTLSAQAMEKASPRIGHRYGTGLEERRSRAAFRTLYKVNPKFWTQYLLMMVGTMGSGKPLASVLSELKSFYGDKGFIDGFCDVLISRQNQGWVVDNLFYALRLTCRNKVEARNLISTVIDALIGKGYGKKYLADIKLGRGYAQLVLFSGKKGSIATTDKIVFELLQKKWTPKVSIPTDIDELKVSVRKSQESLLKYGLA
jgi:hypothetical protein